MAGDVYIFRAEFHERGDAFDQFFLGDASERRDDFQ
jgi:hypothetical protein